MCCRRDSLILLSIKIKCGWRGDWMGADKMHQVKDIMALALRFRVVSWIVPSDTLCVNTMDADNESDWKQRMPTMHRLEQRSEHQGGEWQGRQIRHHLPWKRLECKCSALNILLSWHYCIYRRCGVAVKREMLIVESGMELEEAWVSNNFD